MDTTFRRKQLEKILFDTCEELTQFEQWEGLAYVVEDEKIVGVFIGTPEFCEVLFENGGGDDGDPTLN